MGHYRDRYPHALPPEQAAARLRALTDYWNAQYGTRTDWNGCEGCISGRVLGLSFWSRFTVEPDCIQGELEVSFVAVGMGGRGYLKRKLDHYMNPEVPLHQLQALVPGTTPSTASV